jgi:hypothetical protein
VTATATATDAAEIPSLPKSGSDRLTAADRWPSSPAGAAVKANSIAVIAGIAAVIVAIAIAALLAFQLLRHRTRSQYEPSTSSLAVEEMSESLFAFTDLMELTPLSFENALDPENETVSDNLFE